MAIRRTGEPTDPRIVDRFERGVGWIAHPDELIERASHALAVDGEVIVVDPLDWDGLDDLLEEQGTVAGVVVTVNRHRRDAATVATRHGVPVFLPESLSGLGDDLDAAVRTFDESVPGTDFRAITVVDVPGWTEVGLFDGETLVVGDSLGTTEYYRAGDERLGVQPALRLMPPRDALAGLDPDRVLVGHGAGVHDDAARALADALRTARRRAPAAYVAGLRALLPV